MHDPLQQAPPQGGYPPGYDPRMGPPGQHFGAAPLVEEQDGWGKIGIIMVALAVVFAGGVAFFIVTSGGSKKNQQAAATAGAIQDGDGGAGLAESIDAGADQVAADEVVPVEADQPVTAAIDAGAAAEPAIPDPDDEVGGNIGLLRANGEVDRPAGLVSLAIESEPSGATVIRKRDGVRLGTTPYRYETEVSSANVGFVLKLDGYRSMSVTMPGSKDGVRQVMLLPGKGGVAIPESNPEPAPADDKPVAKKPAKADPAPKKPVVADSKPKRPSKPKKPKKASKPKKPTKPKAPKKPKGGKVDYNADPIPL